MNYKSSTKNGTNQDFNIYSNPTINKIDIEQLPKTVPNKRIVKPTINKIVDSASICNKRHNSQKKEVGKIKVKYCKDLDTLSMTTVNSTTSYKQHIRSGTSDNGNIDQRGKKRIDNAIRYYSQSHSILKLWTFTFGASYPSSEDAKKLFASFVKSINNYLKNESFHYIWVIEIQPKRCYERGEIVPHFHLVTPQYLEQDFINKKWNKVVNKWLKANDKQPDKLYPNLTTFKHSINGYLSKDPEYRKVSLARYLYKGNGDLPINGRLYAIDQKTSKAIKSEEFVIEADNDFIEDVITSCANLKINYCKRKDYVDNTMLFSFTGKSVINLLSTRLKSKENSNALIPIIDDIYYSNVQYENVQDC